GLMSYGVDLVDLYRRSADYVDRILKGVQPSELPIQAPTRFELVVNLKTAKAMGLNIPESFLVRAAEGIERRGASAYRCSAPQRPRGRSQRARSMCSSRSGLIDPNLRFLA